MPRAPLTWQQLLRQCQAEIITLLIMPIHHPPVTSGQRDEQGSPKNTFCLSFPLCPSWPRPELLSALSFDTQVFAQVFPWLEGLLSQAACCKHKCKMFAKHPLCTSQCNGFNKPNVVLTVYCVRSLVLVMSSNKVADV